jgi:HEAT repeat protein
LASTAEHEGTRLFALALLGELGDERATQVARATLADRDKGEALRSTAAIALGQLHSQEAITDILLAAGDPNEGRMLRESAVRALGYLGDASVSSQVAALLQRAPDESFALAAADTLRKLGDRSVAPALEEVERSHPSLAVRRAAQEARQNLLA